MIKGQLFENTTIENPTEEYLNCGFTNVVFKGKIDVVLDTCLVKSLTLEDPEIIRFETPNTPIPDIIIDKNTIQPIHFAKTILYLKHNHSFITDKMKSYANTVKDEKLRDAIFNSCQAIDEHPELSWNDFLVTEPKEVWDLAEVFFADIPEIVTYAVNVREKRYPKEVK